jgi:GTP-binding protein EngB required for normal cell division
MSSHNPEKSVSTALRQEGGVELLDTIDKLRALGIDNDVPLPQLVVAGQQSSGKSSVLEAISGIPFPTNDGLCTRFATEVVLRRASAPSTSVKIIRGTNLTLKDATQANIDSFHEEVKAMTPFGMEKIPQIVKMAANAMSLGEDKMFTKDFLHIEVAGPKQDHLTLVDLPGLFSTTKSGQNDDEVELVKKLSERYMSEPRSIVLAVLSAKNDYANQEIMQTLKKIDPSGKRTLGIITGLDSIERHSAREAEYIELANNDLTPLTLGWHMLRNLSFTDRQNNANRDGLESTFFSSCEPWCTFDPQICGASELKTRLSDVLMSHIGRELKSVIAALDEIITDTERTLMRCGTERSTEKQQREYLYNIAESYYKLVKSSLEGPYDDNFFSGPGRRLRAIVRQRSEGFAKEMRNNGSRWRIEDDSYQWASSHTGVGILQGIDIARDSMIIKRSSYLAKIDDLLVEYACRELQGTFDPLLVGALFRDQSSRWRAKALAYIQDIEQVLDVFVRKVVEHMTDSRRTQSLLLEHLRTLLAQREAAIMMRLEIILAPFEKLHPVTHNPLLLEERGDSDEDVDHGEDAGDSDEDVEYGEDAGSASRLLMESMQRYYNIALHTFIDNTVTIGVELCLLDGLQDLFTPTVVFKLEKEDVKKLASESPEDALQRRNAERRLQKFKAGRDICKKYVVAGADEASLPHPAEAKPTLAFHSAAPANGSPSQVNSGITSRPRIASPKSRIPSSGNDMSQDASSTTTTLGMAEEKAHSTGTTRQSNGVPDHLNSFPFRPQPKMFPGTTWSFGTPFGQGQVTGGNRHSGDGLFKGFASSNQPAPASQPVGGQSPEPVIWKTAEWPKDGSNPFGGASKA